MMLAINIGIYRCSQVVSLEKYSHTLLYVIKQRDGFVPFSKCKQPCPEFELRMQN